MVIRRILLCSVLLMTGSVALARILAADSKTPLSELAIKSVIAVEPHTDQAEVVELFHKYNLLTLPVVDDKRRLLGLVTADDVLEVVLGRK